MKNNVGGWVLFFLSLPTVVVGWLWILFLCLVWVAEWKTLRFQGAGVLTARTRKWAAKFWGFSTTIGRAVLYHPVAYDETAAIDNRTERHEFVHIRQYEDECAWGFFCGLFAALILLATGPSTEQFFAVWLSAWCLSPLAKLPGFLTAVMRYGPKGIYLDAEFERSAYSQTDFILQADVGKSWDEMRDEWREKQKGMIG